MVFVAALEINERVERYERRGPDYQSSGRISSRQTWWPSYIIILLCADIRLVGQKVAFVELDGGSPMLS